ncbi:S-layer homology domain-containing protein [Cohnella sp. WQ 127256]|uniref:S-layer homology domain-containing protein n=1 Tax=Cohnella sp. WQ 127256 TaxID=2938790 RepID=UPI0021176BF2
MPATHFWQPSSLVVYIEYSDGTTEVKRGRNMGLEAGVQGLQFEANPLATFSLVYALEVPKEKLLAAYIQGYPEGTFRPNAPVTRGQLTSMLARFLTEGDIPVATTVSFADIRDDAIEVVKEKGLLTGTSATTFNPSAPMTRAQMATLVVRWMDRF